jgi:hypothetical protein
MWGKLKNSGDEWMYPKLVTDLRFLANCEYHSDEQCHR